MIHEMWWSLPLTLIVFFLARKLAARFKFPLLNPLLVAMVVIIPFLLVTGISYERYFAGSKILNDLLQPAVVALAFPLYEQLHQIRARWKSIITICFIGSCVAMITGTTVALLMGATPQIAASIMPKSVTTRSAAVLAVFQRLAPCASFSLGSSARCSAIRCLTPCAFILKHPAACRWVPPRTPSAPRVAPNWTTRKGRLARWRWYCAELLPRWSRLFCSR